MKNISTSGRWPRLALGLMTLTIGGCTMHPRGEGRLRAAAAREGQIYKLAAAQHTPPPLPISPTPRELVTYALINSPAVESAYWRWRAAIEVIPQAGTEMTTPMLSGNLGLVNGSYSGANSSVGIANMGSSDIRWPSKPAADAKIALEKARAAEWQFRERQFALREAVLTAWNRLIAARAVLALARRQKNLDVSLVNLAQTRLTTGGQSSSGYLETLNAVTLLKLHIAALRRELPRREIAINNLLNRSPMKTILAPAAFPAIAPQRWTMAHLIRLAARRNPQLHEFAWTRRANKIQIQRAMMQYIPNFDLGAVTSLDGITQNFEGAVMFPIVRYQAINAAIREARFNLRRTESRMQQTKTELASRLAIDLVMLQSDRVQLAFFSGRLLPRIRQMEHFSRVSMMQGSGGLISNLMAQKTVLKLREMELDLRVDQADRLADIETIVARPLELIAKSKKGGPMPKAAAKP